MSLSLKSRFSYASLLTGYIPMLCEETTSRLNDIQKPLEELMTNQGTAAQTSVLLSSLRSGTTVQQPVFGASY